MYYVFICEDADNMLDKRQEVRPEHLERLKALESAGRLLVAGPSINKDTNIVNGSIIIAKFEDIAAAESWINDDPFVVHQIYKNITIKPFKASLPEQMA